MLQKMHTLTYFQCCRKHKKNVTVVQCNLSSDHLHIIRLIAWKYTRRLERTIILGLIVRRITQLFAITIRYIDTLVQFRTNSDRILRDFTRITRMRVLVRDLEQNEKRLSSLRNTSGHVHHGPCPRFARIAHFLYPWFRERGTRSPTTRSTNKRPSAKSAIRCPLNFWAVKDIRGIIKDFKHQGRVSFVMSLFFF